MQIQARSQSPVVNPNAAPGVAQHVLNQMAQQQQKRGLFHRKPKSQRQSQAVNQGQSQTINQTVSQSQAALKTRAGSAIGSFFHSLYTWEWTKGVFYWLILSAGTASDLIFLTASFWMSVNANVHELILSYMTEDTARYVTYLATTAYVALPIFIVGLATVQTVGHLKMWKAGYHWSMLWAVIFGIPAVTFLLMDFVTISCSVVNVTFTMPAFFVVLRADSAFIFAFGSLLYFFLGKPQERDRLAAKDATIASLQTENTNALASLTAEKDRLLAEMKSEKEKIIANLLAEKAGILSHTNQEKESLLAKIDVQKDEIESLKAMLASTQKGFTELYKARSQSDDMALEAFGPECINWLKSGIKSASIADITRYTGLTTAKVKNAFRRGELNKAPNSKDENPLILISSLVPWLKQLAVTDRKTEVDIPAIQLSMVN